MKVNSENFGKLVAEYRKNNNLSRQALADLASTKDDPIDQTTVRNIEAGNSNVTMRVLLAVENVIGQQSIFQPKQKNTDKE